MQTGGLVIENIAKVLEFYNNGVEKGRLERGLGKIELHRTKQILKRYINKPDEGADIVLLMGPLYHLQNKSEQIKVLNQAKRVLKKGGLLFCTGISKFSSTTWALSTYGKDNNYLDDDIFMNMIKNEISLGIHNKPKEYPYLISQAYFHTPLELEEEIKSVGLNTIEKCSIEGIIWFTPNLNEKWDNKKVKNNY